MLCLFSACQKVNNLVCEKLQCFVREFVKKIDLVVMELFCFAKMNAIYYATALLQYTAKHKNSLDTLHLLY